MAPKQNLVQVQLQYASGEFNRFIDVVVAYKWWFIAGVIAFLILIWWLWRK